MFIRWSKHQASQASSKCIKNTRPRRVL